MVNSLARQRRRDKKERGRGESVHRTARSSGGTKSRGDVTRLNTLSLERLPTVCKIEASYCRPSPRLIHAKFHFPCASRKSKKKSVLPPIQRSIYAATRDPLSLSLFLFSPKLGAFVGRKTDCSIVLDFIITGLTEGAGGEGGSSPGYGDKQVGLADEYVYNR